MNKQLMMAALLAPVALVQGEVIVNETWSDGERATQDVANNTLAWWSSSSSTSVLVGTNYLTQLTGSSGRAIMAFFVTEDPPAADPAPITPVTVAEGETLLVRFVVSFDDTTPPLSSTNDFRVGVYDSHGYRDLVVVDNHKGTNNTTNANANFGYYTGYAFTGGVDAARPFALRKKFAPSDGILIASTSVYTALGSTTNTGHTTLTAGVDYTGRLMVENRAGAAIVTYSMDNGPTNHVLITRTDTDTPHFTFDSVAFIVGSNVCDGFTLKQVEVSKVASTPQPAITGEITGPDYVVTCPSQTGILYQLEQSASLKENEWLGTAINQAGTGADLTFTLAPPAAGEKKFFRVVPTVNP